MVKKLLMFGLCSLFSTLGLSSETIKVNVSKKMKVARIKFESGPYTGCSGKNLKLNYKLSKDYQILPKVILSLDRTKQKSEKKLYDFIMKNVSEDAGAEVNDAWILFHRPADQTCKALVTDKATLYLDLSFSKNLSNITGNSNSYNLTIDFKETILDFKSIEFFVDKK